MFRLQMLLPGRRLRPVGSGLIGGREEEKGSEKKRKKERRQEERKKEKEKEKEKEKGKERKQTHQHCPRVSAQTVTQQPCQLAVTERDVFGDRRSREDRGLLLARLGRSEGKRGDAVSQRADRLVDLLGLLQAETIRLGLAHALTPRKIDDRELAPPQANFFRASTLVLAVTILRRVVIVQDLDQLHGQDRVTAATPLVLPC